MESSLAKQWREAFFATVQQERFAAPLKEATLQERLGDWTKTLTAVSVAACEALTWHAAAKGHRLTILPMHGEEYLALDVTAFADGDTRWRFPTAAIELENQMKEDRIAYSLWKVMCVKAELRIVFCYRRNPNEGSSLTRFLSDEVVSCLSISDRVQFAGETVVVVGSRDEAATFPYGFFKWWRLDTSTGTFRLF